MNADIPNSRCSFCGKSKDAVASFIAGPSVYICNECVNLCNQLLGQPFALTKDEASEAACGLTFMAGHHEAQIKDWRIAPQGDRRNKYRREWEDNHERIIAHHREQIRQISALCGKLGARDWVAAESKEEGSAA